QDVTGQSYHFPNHYRKLIIEGREFLYYRGVRRVQSKRGIPEYFGCGVIGSVHRDESIPLSAPKRNWKWFCTIERHIQFENPVPFSFNGKLLENCKRQQWGRPRKLPEESYRLILDLAGIEIPEPEVIKVGSPYLPDLERVEATELHNASALFTQRANLTQSNR